VKAKTIQVLEIRIELPHRIMHGAPRTLANSITKLVQTYAKGSTVSWRHTSVTTELVEEKKA